MTLRSAVLVTFMVYLAGILLAVALQCGPIADPALGASVFYYLFAEQEPVACAAGLILLALAVWGVQRGTVPLATSWLGREVGGPWLGALFVLGMGPAGTFLVFQNYLLSQDEFSLNFQSMLFAHGKLHVPLPPDLVGLTKWVTPLFITPNPDTHTLTSWYLPVAAAVRAGFQMLHAPWLCNPALGAGSVLLLSAICRRVWPGESAMKWLPVWLFASSAQFVITCMTAYAMPAHLAFNLLWLWLWVRGGQRDLVLASIVGVLAIGLHQPHVHLLFALPFCWRLVRERRWSWAAYFLVVYGTATLVWLRWYQLISPKSLEHTDLLALPTLKQFLIQPMNLVYLFSWQSAATGGLVLLALRRWRTLPAVVQDAAWASAVTLVFHVFFNASQGHGWGDRYVYSALGAWMLVAVAGWGALVEQVGDRGRAVVLTRALCLGSLLVLLPIRCWQAREFARPFATANAALAQVKADVLLLPKWDMWYGSDLMRNDPFFEDRPLRVYGTQLSAQQLAVLKTRGTVVQVSPQMLERFGLVPIRPELVEVLNRVPMESEK